jgi:hypothetical protein
MEMGGTISALVVVMLVFNFVSILPSIHVGGHIWTRLKFSYRSTMITANYLLIVNSIHLILILPVTHYFITRNSFVEPKITEQVELMKALMPCSHIEIFDCGTETLINEGRSRYMAIYILLLIVYVLIPSLFIISKIVASRK